MSRWEQDEAEQRAYEKHMQAMYDEQRRVQECAEEDAWLRAEVERLKAENEMLRAERPAVVAWLRECADTAHTRDASGELRWAAIRIEQGAHRDRPEEAK